VALHQRQLPPARRRALSQFTGRRQGGDRLGADAGGPVRSRSVTHRRRGRVGRRASGEPASSPEDYISPQAPPFLVAAGDNDNQIDVSHADHFVGALRSRSAAPVVYFRLPGAQHAFDLLRSLRFDEVADGVVAFLEWVRVTGVTRGSRG
jgi:acetyl esterase/lipase